MKYLLIDESGYVLNIYDDMIKAFIGYREFKDLIGGYLEIKPCDHPEIIKQLLMRAI